MCEISDKWGRTLAKKLGNIVLLSVGATMIISSG